MKEIFFLNNDDRIVLCSSKYIKIWNLESNEIINIIYDTYYIHKIKLSLDNKLIITHNSEKEIKIYDVVRGMLMTTIND